jgi:hypothetical protein
VSSTPRCCLPLKVYTVMPKQPLLAATNRVTEQLVGWQLIVSVCLFQSSQLIGNLCFLDLIVLVINCQHVNILRGTIRGDPQETLYRVRSPIQSVRLVTLKCTTVFLVTTMRPRGLSESIVPAPGRSSSVGTIQRKVALETFQLFENQDPVPGKASGCECRRWCRPHPK